MIVNRATDGNHLRDYASPGRGGSPHILHIRKHPVNMAVYFPCHPWPHRSTVPIMPSNHSSPHRHPCLCGYEGWKDCTGRRGGFVPLIAEEEGEQRSLPGMAKTRVGNNNTLQQHCYQHIPIPALYIVMWGTIAIFTWVPVELNSFFFCC